MVGGWYCQHFPMCTSIVPGKDWRVFVVQCVVFGNPISCLLAFLNWLVVKERDVLACNMC